MVWRYLKGDLKTVRPWALELQTNCERFKTLPMGGGAYDQDTELLDAVSVVMSIRWLLPLDAGQLHKVPGPAKKLRRILSSLAESETF